MNEKISLSVPNKTEYVSVVRMTAAFIASQLDCDIDQIEDIKLAVSEACNNAIQHGASADISYDIEFIISPQKLEINIIDHGSGFLQTAYKEPNLADPKENGLGIFIMQSLMDDVIIDTSNQLGTTIKLIKNIN